LVEVKKIHRDIQEHVPLTHATRLANYRNGIERLLNITSHITST